jgi:hypothetical protein
MRIIIFFLLTICVECFGQKQANVWYFGAYAGIDFNNGNPTALLNGQLTFPIGENHNEGTSTISDSSGSLLLYSDGMTVWNRSHQIMQNGTGLLGNFSSTQSSIIVPQPGQPDRYYYLFTVGSLFCCGSVSDGLRYSRIDMCLDGTLGAIIPAEKNIKLLDSVTEKIAVTRHANGIDYWILTHKFYSDEFYAMRLTSNGIIDTIISSIGSSHTGAYTSYVQGQLKISPNGQLIAIGGAGGLRLLELFDFDNSTGVVSNFKPLNRIDNGDVYGVEFSPDNSKLYVQSSSYTPFGLDIAQYDLSSGNITLINSSLNSIYHNSNPSSSLNIGLQIAPNGKIYMISNGNYGTLSVINNPNIYGAGCNYQAQSISLGGRMGSLSLPAFISGFDYSNGLIQCNQSSISENRISALPAIYPNPFSRCATLEFNNPDHKAYLLDVYDIFGQLVLTINNITTEEVKLERTNLINGLYFFQLRSCNQIVVSGKFIIE